VAENWLARVARSGKFLNLGQLVFHVGGVEVKLLVARNVLFDRLPISS
jgi:hypothetical protein